jgi:hypothetical protein
MSVAGHIKNSLYFASASSFRTDGAFTCSGLLAAELRELGPGGKRVCHQLGLRRLQQHRLSCRNFHGKSECLSLAPNTLPPYHSPFSPLERPPVPHSCAPHSAPLPPSPCVHPYFSHQGLVADLKVTLTPDKTSLEQGSTTAGSTGVVVVVTNDGPATASNVVVQLPTDPDVRTRRTRVYVSACFLHA